MHSLITPQLELEPLTVNHAPEMFELLSDLQIYRYLDDAPPISLEHLRNRYVKLEARKSPDGSEVWLNWVVRVRGQQLVGVVQATVFKPISEPHSTWIAYVFSPRHWGHGYAYEATASMITHLASDYGVAQYLATVEIENTRSIHLLERLGFRLATPQEAGCHELTVTEQLFLR
jgi:[ribosomal protein S5]-alanine N-acetyltransferase